LGIELPRITLLGSPVNKPGHAGQMPKGVAARNDAVRAKDAAHVMSSRVPPPPDDCGGVEPPLRPSAAAKKRQSEGTRVPNLALPGHRAHER